MRILKYLTVLVALALGLSLTTVSATAVEKKGRLKESIGVGASTALAPLAQVLPPVQKKPAKRKVQKSRLAKYKWASYKGPQDMSWDPYVRATGERKQLLGRIALAPKAKWFGGWISENDITRSTKEYISNAQAGNPNALVQMTIFRMDPWYTESKVRPPNKREIAEYKTWIRRSAAAIGNTRTALILQPDLTFLRTVPNFELSSSLIKFAAQEYSKLPRTYVYLEAGAADWPAPGQGGAPEAVRLLEAAGIQYADGVATNTTHYSSTTLDIHRVADIIELLRAKGYSQPLKGVINTSSNGQPFDFGTYQGPDPDEAWACRRPNDNRTCVALGIPPTANVASKRWGLDEETRALARKYIDGYLWIGRPWLNRQNSPFLPEKAITLVKNWEYK